MISVNPLRTEVLITTDEVIFHAPTDQSIDPRIILNSIIVAERRLIKPALCDTLYNTLCATKNKLITADNLADLTTAVNSGRPTDRQQLVLQLGDYVNSDTYLDAAQLSLWQKHLHKIVAECVWLVSLPVNRARFTSKGVMKNFPESVTSDKESATVDLPDLKHLLDKGLNERISPMMEDMHKYLCAFKFPGYDKDCGCDTRGTAYRKSTGVLFGLYEDHPHRDGNSDYYEHRKRGW